MVRVTLGGLALLLLLPLEVQAQETGRFTVVRGTDTVATEGFTREDHELSGQLVRTVGAARERFRYRATLLDDATAPLLEVSAWRASDDTGSIARQRSRVIFKGDSVAVDAASRWAGVTTTVVKTEPAALPYLNLSVALLEQATRRARVVGGDSVPVPFFNLGGGQTAIGLVRRVSPDSVTLTLGRAVFHLAVDSAGGILGGVVPAQGVRITREPGR